MGVDYPLGKVLALTEPKSGRSPGWRTFPARHYQFLSAPDQTDRRMRAFLMSPRSE